MVVCNAQHVLERQIIPGLVEQQPAPDGPVEHVIGDPAAVDPKSP
jgi:hypothetical protein